MKYSINLIEKSLLEAQRSSRESKRNKSFIYTGLVVFVLSIGVSVAFYIQLTKVLEQQSGLIKEYQSELNSENNLQNAVSRGDVEIVDEIHKKKMNWSKNLGLLVKHLPNQYSIQKVNFRQDGIEIEGQGVYDPNQQFMLILNRYIQDLTSDSLTHVFLKDLNIREALVADVSDGPRKNQEVRFVIYKKIDSTMLSEEHP